MATKFPDSIQKLIDERNKLRRAGKYKQADRIRSEIEKNGYKVNDSPDTTDLRLAVDSPPQLVPGSGLLAIFGSGELSPTGRRVHEFLVKKFPKPVHIALLETSNGYEDNPHLWYMRIAEFLKKGLVNYHPHITRVEALTKNVVGGTDDPVLLNPLKNSQYIHTGAGSPSYAVRHLLNSLALKIILERLNSGASVSIASATAIAFGKFAIPVYEIYFAGHDPAWLRGLDVLGSWGLNITIVPHWNNQEGGKDIDTRFAYMGQNRFQKLLQILPGPTTIMGLDEHTTLIADFKRQSFQVLGLGVVTLYGSQHKKTFVSGEIIPFAEISHMCYVPHT